MTLAPRRRPALPGPLPLAGLVGLALLLGSGAAGCATAGEAGAQGRSSARCPGSQEVCLTGTDCTYDRVRDCTLCLCRRADREEPRQGSAAKARPETDRGPALPPIR